MMSLRVIPGRQTEVFHGRDARRPSCNIVHGNGRSLTRTPNGDLPSGKVIAERFGRRERWGRLVKQAGTTGRLEPAVSQ
jgi:hypothetical protein